MKQIIAYGSVVCAIIGGAWAFGDVYGFRPATKAEVLDVDGKIEVVGRSVDWLRLENYERRLARGQRLTRRECSDYRRLAARLNVTPLKC